MHTPTKAALSAPRRQLLSLLQRVNFGHIESLHVRDGEPQFEPPPRVLAETKFGAQDNGPRPPHPADRTIHVRVLELFQSLDRLGTGVVDVLEVRHGLPFRMIRKESTL